jgi:hypothetical protein
MNAASLGRIEAEKHLGPERRDVPHLVRAWRGLSGL